MKKLIAVILLMLLMGCSKGIKTEYITLSIPDTPPRPSYYSVDFVKKDNLFCLDEKNAKNLMKNKKIQDSHTKSVEDILEDLRNRNKK